jgi:hypothetical protein
MALQYIHNLMRGTGAGRYDAAPHPAARTRSNGCSSQHLDHLGGNTFAAERQSQRAARRIGSGGSRSLNAIDRSLRRCRLGKVFLSDVPWLSGD